MAKFESGRKFVTPGVLDVISDDVICSLLDRHLAGDWGDVPPADARQNEWSLEHGERLVSMYNVDGTKILIITERDRSATTVLLPEDY
ncbi:MAG: hypothetical protein WC343_00790 [Bacilli bacterium]|jgi:hypothetical protein